MHGTLTAPSGEIIDHNERRWDSRAAAHIAGAQWATLLSWRRRYGFLGGGAPGPGGNATPFRHSVVEVCTVAAVASLIRAGLSPRVACGAEWHLHTMIEMLIAGERENMIFVLGAGGPDCRRLIDPLSTIDAECAIVLNLPNVIDRPLGALGLSTRGDRET